MQKKGDTKEIHSKCVWFQWLS